MKKTKNITKLSIIAVLTLCAIGVGVHYFSNRSRRAMEKQILAMDGMGINLSLTHADAIYDGTDSVYSPSDGMKLIVFVDSLSCSGCFLSHLESYYEINDSLRTHNGEMIIVLHPQKGKLEEIKSRLNHERFPFWCIVDKNGEFLRQNPEIPDNQLLHTFMVDKNNKIILVGDPTRNDRIKELFYREVLK